MAAKQDWRIRMSPIRRQAVNHTIQGSAADITKTALSLIFRELPKGSYIVAAVHDEILVESPIEDAPAVADLVARLMEHAARSYLPTVNLGKMKPSISDHWEEH
jgi:DNA polymerase-1